jgi:hypothetical protein
VGRHGHGLLLKKDEISIPNQTVMVSLASHLEKRYNQSR